MATTLTPPSPNNTKHWWPRITAGNDDHDNLFTVNVAAGTSSRPSWMIPAMTTSSNKSSRFNLASVIGFGSKSKRRHAVEIQDPPSQIRSLPLTDHNTYPDRRLSRAVTCTSSDLPPSPSNHLTDPFISTTPHNDRRSSTHSDKSLSKRLIHKIDGKANKSSSRLPVGQADTKRRESRDRSSTLPSGTRLHASEPYQALRAVQPPWAVTPSSDLKDDSTLDAATLRPSKASKPGLPWSGHQHTHSSSSISDDNRTAKPKSSHNKRPSTSSSIPASSSSFTSHFSINSIQGHPPGHHADIIPLLMPLPTPALASTSSRAQPRPPPTSGLPPTPTPGPPPSTELHTLRSRSGTDASTSAVSFASSLSSLSFNSRPSPQEPSSAYPSLLNETLPVPGIEGVIPRRSSNSGSSSRSYKDDKDPATKPTKSALPMSRHVQSPSVSSAASSRRDHILSPTPEVGKTVRRQRSFHNTSLNAPTPLQPTLRHYNSFDPPTPPTVGGQVPAPPPPPLRSPPLPPLQDLPPLPSSAVSITKRGSTGKDSITSPRRRLFGVNRHDRDRERKQELDNVDTSVAPSTLPSIQNNSSSPSSSSWFDDRGMGSEPASASSTSTSTAQDVAQHIVPPAELLRLGAEWERESQGRNGLRRAKSNWAGGTRGSPPSSLKMGSSLSVEGATTSTSNAATASGAGSKLPRSASLLSKATSAPSFINRADESPVSASFAGSAASSGSRSADGHTSLSPPPPRRRSQKTAVRTVMVLQGGGGGGGSTGLLPPPPPRRVPSSSSSLAIPPPKGALIERKPSFLDMSSRQSVTLDVPSPQLGDRELERDSFLELSSREMGIQTIRESISSVDSFME